jgi:hypothetical protein
MERTTQQSKSKSKTKKKSDLTQFLTIENKTESGKRDLSTFLTSGTTHQKATIDLSQFIKSPSDAKTPSGVGTVTPDLSVFVKKTKLQTGSTGVANLEKFIIAQKSTATTKKDLSKFMRGKKVITEPTISGEGMTSTEVGNTILETIADAVINKPKGKNTYMHVIDQLRNKTKIESKTTLTKYLVNYLISNRRLIIQTTIYIACVAVSGSIIVALITGSGLSFGSLLLLISKLGMSTISGGFLADLLKSTAFSYAKEYSISKLVDISKRNPKMKKLLEAQIKPEILVRTLNNIGINIRETNISAETILRNSISKGVDLIYQGDLTNFAISYIQGKVAQKISTLSNDSPILHPVDFCKRNFEILGRMKEKVVKKLLTKEYKNIDELVHEIDEDIQEEIEELDEPESILIDDTPATSTSTQKGKERMTEEEERELQQESILEEKVIKLTKEELKTAEVEPSVEEVEKIKERIKKREKGKGKEKVKIYKVEEKERVESSGGSGSSESLTNTAVNMMKSNKIMATATVIGVTLAGIGLARGKDDIIPLLKETSRTILGNIEIPESALKNINWLKESELAKYSMYTLISKSVGVEKFIGSILKLAVPSQMIELLKLTDDIKKTKSESVKTRLITKFFDVLLGEMYTKKKLMEMKNNRHKLRQIAKSKRLKVDKNTTADQLISAILSQQQTIMNQYLAAFTRAIGNTVVTAASTYATRAVFENSPAIFDKIKEFMAQDVPSDDTIRDLGDAIKTRPTASEEDPIIKAEEPLVEESQKERRERLRKEAHDYLEKLRKERPPPQIKVPESEQPTVSGSGRKTAQERAQEIIDAEKERLRLKDIQDKMAQGVMTATPTGEFIPAPDNENLLDPKIRDVLKDIYFTPLSDLLIRETAKSSMSWIPGVGWIQGAINNINLGLGTAETLKDIYKISNVVLEATQGSSSIDIGPESIKFLDESLGVRIPNLSNIVENMVRQEPISALHAVERAMREIFGKKLSKEEAALVIARELFGRINYDSDVMSDIGMSILSGLSSLGLQ